ncbi:MULTISPECIES: Rha family transcriptional regulator [Enterococcus]|uniref:Rha family transcriptional regulator n=1 Tax=Enterococcus lactis TaxID=357441 RepID=A0AAJ1SQN7_9ENTE|nr:MULTISPECIES: Rha family transcriptional regulator [Enterococcus]MDP8584454.1 Rha family transcriptional regulator [Listeria innocua]MDP8591397.1 Rha family transcriptional regulator [Enterococcus lactis]
MKDLVFLQSDNLNNDPFTTDEVIAEYSGNSRESVTRLIRKYQGDLEEFGTLGFEIRPIAKTKMKIYHLNQQQATLLITYLDNTKPVRKFKKELVKQFYEMEKELMARRLERTKGKQIRCSMTDAIKEAGFSGHFYKHFTDLVYEKALGFNAKQLREAREANAKATPLDFLTTKEQAAVNQIEELVSSLIQLGRSYDEIKDILNVGIALYQTTIKMPEMAH